MRKYLEVLKSPNRPKIGVVLGGGGVRAQSSIALYEWLQQMEIPIDVLIGCSGGSIVCGGIAIGLSVEQLRRKLPALVSDDLFQLDYSFFLNALFKKFDISKAFFKKEPYLKNLSRVFGDVLIEELPIKVVLQTTDAKTGEGVLIKKGNLAEAIYASGCPMPVFPPILIDGRYLGDGGFFTNLPILAACEQDIDILLVMDFGEVQHEPKTYLEYIDTFYDSYRSFGVHLQSALAENLHHYEIIHIEVDFPFPIGFANKEMFAQIAQSGIKSVERVRQRIIDAIEMFPEANKRVYDESK